MYQIKKMPKTKKRELRPNSRVYPNNNICNFISNLALASAFATNEKQSSCVLMSSVSRDDNTSCCAIINNVDSCLERFIPKGATPEHISFFPNEPSRRGDTIPIPNPDREFIIFIYWKNGVVDGESVRVDLDTSFVGYGSEYKSTDQVCSYYQRVGFRNTVKHSGDVTDAPNGAAEFITFNLKELKNANLDVQSIMVVTQSYNNISFDNMSDAIVGIGYMPSESEPVGDGPNGSIVISACRLTGKSTTNVSAVLHLSREEDSIDTLQFICINAHNTQQSCHSAYSSNAMLQNIVQKFDIWSNSLNAPIKELKKEIIRASSLNEVEYIDKDGAPIHFSKMKDETSFEFHTRMSAEIV